MTTNDCPEIQELISSYVDGETTEDESAQVESHIETCASCRRFHKKLIRGIETLDRLGAVDPTFDFLARLDEKIVFDLKLAGVLLGPEDPRKTGRFVRPRDGWFFTFWLPAAALLLVAFVGHLIFQMRRNIEVAEQLPKETRPDATLTQDDSPAPGDGTKIPVPEPEASSPETAPAPETQPSSELEVKDSSEPATEPSITPDAAKPESQPVPKETTVVRDPGVERPGSTDRARLREMLTRMGNRRLTVEERLVAVHIYVAARGAVEPLADLIRRGNEPRAFRIGILEALAAHPHQAGLGLLVRARALFEDDVFGLCAGQTSEEGFRLLAGMLPGVPARDRHFILDVLATADHPAARTAGPALVDFFVAVPVPDERTRLLLIDALGELGGPEAVASLSMALSTEESPACRREMVRALGRIGTKEAAPTLIAALGDADPALRDEAAWALGRLPYDPVTALALVGFLEDALESRHTRLAGSARTSLRRLLGRSCKDAAAWREAIARRKEAVPDPNAPGPDGVLAAVGDDTPVHFAQFPLETDSVTFLIDVSESMTHEGKLEQAARELRLTLGRLRAGTRVQLLKFASGVTPCFQVPERLDGEGRAREAAKAWVDNLRSMAGGTNLKLALEAALRAGTDTIFILTDGQADMDRSGYLNLRRTVRERNRGQKARIHIVAVLRSVMVLEARPDRIPLAGLPWVDCLRQVAEDSGGTFLYTK